MRIAMISEHASPLVDPGSVDAGGQNVHVAALAAALTRAGHRVTVHTRREDPDQPHRVTAPDGYQVEHVDAGPARRLPKDELLPHMAEFGDRLVDSWRRQPPDVAHAHFWMSGLAMTAAARRVPVPTLQTYHALGVVKRRHLGDADTSPAPRIELERRIGQQVDRIVATCFDELTELVELGISRHKIDIVPCGVDLQRFRPRPWPPRTGRPRVVTVGRLVARKGFDVAIEAIARVPEAELIIAGGPEGDHLDSDPEAIRLRELARRLGVADRVRLTGQVARDAMPALLGSADVVLCTPAYEPFGIVPLEAMACARPVVATAVGGLMDTVVNETTGYLVRPGDPDAVADRIRTLINDQLCARRMGRAGHQRVQERYSWDRVAADTVDCYRRALHQLVEEPLPIGGRLR